MHWLVSHWTPNWAVPWAPGEVTDFLFLLVCYVFVSAVPVIYAFKANLRDPLARAVLTGTSAPALAFGVTILAVVAVHAGWTPDPSVWHWISRVTYVFVGLGELFLLLALLRVYRENESS